MYLISYKTLHLKFIINYIIPFSVNISVDPLNKKLYCRSPIFLPYKRTSDTAFEKMFSIYAN